MYEINSSAFTHRENRANAGKTDTLADERKMQIYLAVSTFYTTFAENIVKL